MIPELVVFEIANNHFGDVEHGKRLIDSLWQTWDSRPFGVPCVKFQFRDLDTFIHPDYREANEPKHIKRFLETRLSWEQYGELIEHARGLGFQIMVTPFDESSVLKMDRFHVEHCKVASCSTKDWPLLQAIANQNRPIIISTGGCSVSDIDRLYSFFTHRGKEFALNHCIAEYPTEPVFAALGAIPFLKQRYGCTVGWSSHSHPKDDFSVMVAYASGARLFEVHVCLPGEYPQNAYSKNPEQLASWLKHLELAAELCAPFPLDRARENVQLDSLRRGVFVQDGVEFYAMPMIQPIPDLPANPLKSAVHQIKAMLREASIELPPDFQVEYSHHYGVDEFEKTGATLITIVNRDYAKKLIVMLPGQTHPAHYHKRKEETFHILHGELALLLDGREFNLKAGQTALVQPGVWHAFGSDEGCIFEEISTTAFKDDSVYADTSIQKRDRKTTTAHWGRYELEDV